ncbi:MAG: hybrid sensor histidine kinase/response regulator [Proteobacteria bacterium]|nr:MAG: hybrid sensor histidine kinase/response regulator [Pseudomonadota bacterium]
MILQERLAESEFKAREIANNLPMIIWTARPDGYVDWYNDWWYEYLGQPRGTEWDDPTVSPMHPDDVPLTIKIWNECLRTGKFYTMEQRFRRASDGEYRWHIVRGIPIRNEQGLITKWIGGNTDIHDAKCLAQELSLAKQELEEKSRLLETVLIQMPHAVIIADASGKPIFSNPQIEKVWRHPEVHSQRADDYAEWVGFHKDGSHYQRDDWPMARSLLKSEIVVNEDTDVLLGDGTRGIMRLSSAPVRNAQDEVIAGVILCEDVTEKIHSVEELMKARVSAEMANQAKSYFLANMSHEIRTPLGAILGFSTLLKERGLESVERDHYVDTIIRNGNALTRIIDDILDLAKVEAGKLETEEVAFSLHQLAADVIDLFKDKVMDKDIYLFLNLDHGIPEQICSDPTRIRQILVNLIGNAVKFTEVGGVEVNARAVPTSDGAIKVTIDVKDTGIGMDSEHKEKLFRPFTQADNSMTRKFGGTGLGLALSQRLSHALSGEISISEGELGKGCTFSLTFIAHSAEVSIDKQDRLHKPIRVQSDCLKDMKILVVDDSPDNQFLVARLLMKNGALVETAQDGDEGYRMALSGSFDVVLMDIQMPTMDGYQAKQALDMRGYKKPVIALTAHAMIDERFKTEAAGFAGHLTKPLIAAELLKTVASIGKILH